MTVHVRVSGTWREVTDPQVRVSGTWRPVQEIWTRVSGTWQQVYQRFLIAIASTLNVIDVEASPAAASASISVNTDGTVTFTGNASSASTTWGTPTGTGVGTGRYCRLIVSSGSAPTSGPAVNTWFEITTTRTWTIATGPGPATLNGTWVLDFSYDGSTVADSTTITASAQSVT